jgi:hypothetical protein
MPVDGMSASGALWGVLLTSLLWHRGSQGSDRGELATSPGSRRPRASNPKAKVRRGERTQLSRTTKTTSRSVARLRLVLRAALAFRH